VEVKPGSFIYEFPQTLSRPFCEGAISKFELDPNKEVGRFGEGTHDPNFKASTDLTDISNRAEWQVEGQAFLDSVTEIFAWFQEFVGNEDQFDYPGCRIQRTEPGQKYEYHVDTGPVPGIINRMLALIWYLNDVEEGGETEFLHQGIKVRPEAGKLVVFPPYWTHPHRGLTPVSGTKYICTTWLRVKMWC